MKKVRAQVEYVVPHWPYCNSDSQEFKRLDKDVCKFCVKTRHGARCLLHDCSLRMNDDFIEKAEGCCSVTSGYKSTIISESEEPPRPKIDPKKIIKQTLDLYTKTVSSLVADGYPQQLAESIAKDYMLGK